MAHESEKARLERIVSEFIADSPEETAGREGISGGVRRRIGEEELLTEGGGGERCPLSLQERGLAGVKQLLRDEMAYKGMPVERLANITGVPRNVIMTFFASPRRDMQLGTLFRLAEGLGVNLCIWFEERDKKDE